MLPLMGLLIGLIIGLFVNVAVPEAWSHYLALLVLSGVDILLSVLNKKKESKNNSKNFLLEFVSNTVLAMLLAALGKQINFELSTILAFVFTFRIFNNFRDIVASLYDSFKDRQSSIRAAINEESTGKNDGDDKK